MADEALTKADLDKAVKAALDAAKVDFDEEVKGLKDKNRELLGKLRSASEIKPEDLAAVEAERDKALGELAEATKAVKTLTKERDDAVKSLESETGFSQTMLMDNGLNSALAEAGVTNPALLKAAKAMMRGGLTVAKEGDQRIVKMGEKALADAVKEWAGTDEAKHFITAPLNGGGGAAGGKGGEGGKTVTRSQWDGMSHIDRSNFSKEGGKVVDAA